MTDQTNANPPANGPEHPRCRGRGRGRRFLFLTLVVLVAGFTGALVSKAMSSGYGFGPPHWRGGLMGEAFDPARAEERADRMVKHFAIEIDATAEQQEKLRTVMKATVKDLLPLREQAQFARRQVRILLTQPTIDRAAIEKFRADQLALADTFSKRVTQAVADAAEVLTPEQRRKVDERLEALRAHRGWNRG
jgi:protein CpxP